MAVISNATITNRLTFIFFLFSLARVIIPATDPKVVEWLEGTKIIADEEFRKAITAYAQSGGKWVSKEVMKRWIEVQVSDADCELPKVFRAFHAKHGRYPTHAEVRDAFLPPGGPIRFAIIGPIPDIH